MKKESTTETTTKPKELPSNIFNLNAKPGEQYGAFTLKSIEPFNQGQTSLPFSINNFSADFSGETTIDVEYTYTAPGEPGFADNFIRFEVKGPNSLKKIPQIRGDEIDTWFSVSNVEVAKASLGLKNTGKTGAATIVVKDYSVNRFPSEVGDGATFVRIVN